jgi:hypothetical protein
MRAAKARALSILSIAIALPLHAAVAKSPATQDEAAVREIVVKIYAPYSQPVPEVPEDGSYAPDNAAGAAASGYEPPYTQSLAAQIARWDSLMQESEELYGLNGFDWYCQCQDNDNATAKLLSQHYKLRSKGGLKPLSSFRRGVAPRAIRARRCDSDSGMRMAPGKLTI